MASYRGVTLNGKTQAELEAEMRAINAAQAQPASSRTARTAGTAGTAGTAMAVVPPRNDLVGEGYNAIVEQNPNALTGNNNAIPDNNSAAGINNTPFMMAGGYTQPYTPVRTLSSQDSAGVAKKYGLQGINDTSFAGLTTYQAEQKAQELKNKAMGQVSQNTSYSFNPETISGTKKSLQNLQLKLNDTMNSPWNDKGTKAIQSKGLFESTANDISKMFNTQEEFQNQYQNDLNFKQSIDSFVQQGGNIESITTRIAPKPTIQEQDQSLTDYLSNGLAPDATPEQQKAYNSLIPENEIAQQQIMQLAQIPKEQRNLFFGTPEQVGILEERKVMAEEKKKILAQQAEREKENVRAQAQFTIQQNNADLEIASATIEKNRVGAKNYMTGMLAKLGALNTTGAAPEALTKLEQNYQQQSQQLKSKVQFANRGIELKLTGTVNDLESQKEDAIYAVQENLSLEKEEVSKEIYKLEQASTKEIYSILNKSATAFRTQTEKYEKEAKDLVDKDIKERQRILEKFNPAAFLKPYGITDTRKSGKLAKTAKSGRGLTATQANAASMKQWTLNFENQLNNERGDDGYTDPYLYAELYNEFIANKLGTSKDFIAKFPPKNYVNPEATNLPKYLQTPKEKKSGQDLSWLD